VFGVKPVIRDYYHEQNSRAIYFQACHTSVSKANGTAVKMEKLLRRRGCSKSLWRLGVRTCGFCQSQPHCSLL